MFYPLNKALFIICPDYEETLQPRIQALPFPPLSTVNVDGMSTAVEEKERVWEQGWIDRTNILPVVCVHLSIPSKEKTKQKQSKQTKKYWKRAPFQIFLFWGDGVAALHRLFYQQKSPFVQENKKPLSTLIVFSPAKTNFMRTF